ncbi:autotransporter outer membrane beta-barrel domain-containing protein [Synergistaceae bacterium OttesenSCG-928-D05]|nr:autotransporter outer membrane beta-barrel domain-containing protein [Synergistaceae bacterium OttesenSCG-928-D05]
MKNGAISIVDDTSWAMAVNTASSIDLTNVATNSANLLQTSSFGNVNALDSVLAGNILHDSTSAGVLAVALDNTQWTGTANVASSDGAIDLLLANNSRWSVTGNSNTNGALNLGTGNTVDYSASALGTVVTVDSLSGNGNFLMKTDIAAQTADKLVVTGTSDGSHNIAVANQGSAVVTGNERVTLVETADDGADFDLLNHVELGAYRYVLGSLEGDAGGQEWFLYADRGSNPAVDTPVLSNPASSAVDTFIGSYLLAYVENNTLMQRLGDLRNETLGGRSGAWFRAYGGKFESDARDYARGFDMDYWGVQIGYDRQLEKSIFKNGETYAGVFFGLGNGDIDFKDVGYGTGDVDHKTLGAYMTYMKDSGFYVDAVAKYIWSETSYSVRDSSGAMVHANDVDSNGLGLSLETGKRFHFGETGKNNGRWYAEPQVQLSYQHMNGGTYHVSNGLQIGVDSYDSLIGRVGFLLGYQSDKTNVYAKFSYLKEFSGDLDICANGLGVGRESLDDNWFVYGLGVTHRVNDRNALYLDVQRSSGGDFEQQWQLNGGWRISF